MQDVPKMAWSINSFSEEKVSEGLIQAVDKQEPPWYMR